jgi:mRNA-degrading endonuclease HigB of HigAB toxin-antitoxin module
MARPTEYERQLTEYVDELRKSYDKRVDELLEAHRKYAELQQWLDNIMKDEFAGPLMKEAIFRYKLANIGYEDNTGIFNGK